MKITNTFQTNFRKRTIDPRGSEFISLASSLNGNGQEVTVPILLSALNTSQIAAYAEEISPANAIGMINTSNKDFSAIAEMLDSGAEYKARVVGVGGANILVVRIEEYAPEAGAITSDNDTLDIEAEKHRIISEGICSEADLERNIKVMRGHRCSDEMIRQILATYRHYDKPAMVPKTIYIDPDPKSKEESIFSLCLLNTLIGAATIYEGDKSVGKNVCAETVAMVRNQPYYIITFNRMMTADDVYGSKSTDNSASALLTLELAAATVEVQIKGEAASQEAKKKAAEFELLKAKCAAVSIVQDASQLVEWLQNGGVMVFNEANMAEANFFASFTNQITDGTGFLDVPGIGRIPVNKDCVLIGTQNADYTGTQEQNDATMSRFGCIEFPYPNSIKNQLKAVVGKDKLDDVYFTQCDSLYQTLLKSVRAGTVSNSCLNIRGFCRALNAVAQIKGLTKLKKQIQIHVINTCPNDERTNLMMQVNDKISV